jgi:hypothetical protein
MDSGVLTEHFDNEWLLRSKVFVGKSNTDSVCCIGQYLSRQLSKNVLLLWSKKNDDLIFYKGFAPLGLEKFSVRESISSSSK